MINQIFLDTNIYIQLGLNFHKHIDYVNFKRYCYSSGSEIRLSYVVYEELIDYYKNRVIEPSLKDIRKSIEKLNTLSDDMFPDIDFSRKDKFDLIGKIKKRLEEESHFARPLINKDIPEIDLVDFLINNKQFVKKDNTRDFLIFLNAVNLAIQYPEDQIVIISNDSIFHTNDYFKGFLKNNKIKNLITFQSIPSFLSEYSIKIDFVTSESLGALISEDEIRRQIEDDIDSIPSHISGFYYSIRRKFNVEEFDVINMKVTHYYTYKELDTNKLKVLFHIVPKVKIVFEPEKEIEALKKYLNEVGSKPIYYLETFDEQFRPVYNTELLFIYTVTVDDKNSLFKELCFSDFFPDYYDGYSYNP